jgi:bone morphogenetic protein receptor type-2
MKMFSAEQREFFDNEKFVYHLLSNHQHQNILQYKGWQEFTVTSVNMLLVLERVQPGNLREFLSRVGEDSPLDIEKAAKIMRGVASGISFLHGDNKDDLVIAHRDLTTKNILLDMDLNAKISDFGLSLYTNGSKYYWAGREKQAEFSSLAEAGTLRYMAPELLEGAVNLKDCENALKQADVYALALILWEIANCSFDLLLNNDACHKLPFETEIGKDICMESLSRYVVTRRDRPSFTTWKDSQLCRSLRDTLNESWDPEPDARLTALCIVERLTDIHLCKKTPDSVTPLEVGSSSPWTGRNACLQRNLLDENSEEKSMEYLVTSEKHLNNVIAHFNNMSSSNDSYGSNNTTNTELSSYSQIQQQPIPFLHNIQR